MSDCLIRKGFPDNQRTKDVDALACPVGNLLVLLTYFLGGDGQDYDYGYRIIIVDLLSTLYSSHRSFCIDYSVFDLAVFRIRVLEVFPTGSTFPALGFQYYSTPCNTQ